jgi:NADH:ubiquinone oxidoreductase subunit 2 (subunit N)
MAAYSGEKKGHVRAIHMEKATAIAISIAVIITIALGIYPQPLISIAHNAASYLLKI